MNLRRVVITGLGIYSCIGKNLEEVRDSLFKGKSGIVLDPQRKEFGYRSALTGTVKAQFEGPIRQAGKDHATRTGRIRLYGHH